MDNYFPKYLTLFTHYMIEATNLCEIIVHVQHFRIGKTIF